MTTTAHTAVPTWSLAAADLARRVNRRAHWAAFNRPLGAGVLAAGLAALAWRLLGPALPGLGGDAAVPLLVAAGVFGGAFAGRRAARRVRAVDSGDAAWALDRLAEVGGRGLAAAVASGPAASEAAWAEPRIGPPPRVRLLPPGGLVPLVAGLLLVALALLAGRETPPRGPVRAAALGAAGGAVSAPGPGPGGAEDPAKAAEARARALDDRAAASLRVRTALGLPPEGPLDPRELAALLADETLRQKAAAAAVPGTPLAELLRGSGGEASGEALANLLQQDRSDQAEASRLRREAAADRVRTSALPIPPRRRSVVRRYLERIGASHGP